MYLCQGYQASYLSIMIDNIMQLRFYDVWYTISSFSIFGYLIYYFSSVLLSCLTTLCLFLSYLYYGCMDGVVVFATWSVSFLVSVSQVMTDQATRLGMLVCLCRRFGLQGRFLPEFLQNFFLLNWLLLFGHCFCFGIICYPHDDG